MPKYYELDRIDPLLTEEEKMFRNTVREFVNERVVPKISEWFADGEFPAHLVPEIAHLGILGANLNLTGYVDGFDPDTIASNVAYGLAMQELERGDSGLRSFASVQSALIMFPILEYGSEEQKKFLLPKLYRGEIIGCFGLTEEHGGSDPAAMVMEIYKVKGGYKVKGEKKKEWITNGEIADGAVIWAYDEKKTIKGFWLPKDTPGFSAKPMVAKKYKNSMRASVTSRLILEECFIPEENMLPKAVGTIAYMKCLEKAQYGIDWGVIGAAYACFAGAKEFVKSRVLFGEPLAKKQLVQYELADMSTNIRQMQKAMYTDGRLADRGELDYIDVSAAKFLNVTRALKIALMAEELLGANRISWEYHSPRHAANLRAVETYEGTRFIHALRQAKKITGHRTY